MVDTSNSTGAFNHFSRTGSYNQHYAADGKIGRLELRHNSNIELGDNDVLRSYLDGDGFLNEAEFNALLEQKIIAIDNTGADADAPKIVLGEKGQILSDFSAYDTNNDLIIDSTEASMIPGPAVMPPAASGSDGISFTDYVTSAVASATSTGAPTVSADTQAKFDAYDATVADGGTSGDGEITVDEFLANRMQDAQTKGYTHDETAQTAVFNAINTDGGDSFTIDEYQKFSSLTPEQKEFAVLDTSNDHSLSTDEIATALYGGDITEAEKLVYLVNLYSGSDGNTELSLDEYKIVLANKLLGPEADRIPPEDQFLKIFEDANTNGDTTLSYDEIRTALIVDASVVTDAILNDAEVAYNITNPDASVDGQFNIATEELVALLIHLSQSTAST